jgi:HPt (histidine-containing phosphotransfer) domain-containing protein
MTKEKINKGQAMNNKNHVKTEGGCCSLDYLLNNLGRNEAAAKRLVSLFVEHFPNLVQRLDESVKTPDLHALQQAVHDIRGNCVLFSAHECLEQARRIETGLHDHFADNTAGQAGIDWFAEALALRRSLEKMVDELKGFIDEDQAAAGRLS